MEEYDGGEHDDTALEDALPDPDKEGLSRERSPLLKSLIEGRELHDGMDRDVLVEDEGEDREVGVQGCITEHEKAIVNRDCHEEEADREDGLND